MPCWERGRNPGTHRDWYSGSWAIRPQLSAEADELFFPAPSFPCFCIHFATNARGVLWFSRAANGALSCCRPNGLDGVLSCWNVSVIIPEKTLKAHVTCRKSAPCFFFFLSNVLMNIFSYSVCPLCSGVFSTVLAHMNDAVSYELLHQGYSGKMLIFLWLKLSFKRLLVFCNLCLSVQYAIASSSLQLSHCLPLNHVDFYTV